MNINQARELVKKYDEVIHRKFGKTPVEEQIEKLAEEARIKSILFRGTALERGKRIVAKKLEAMAEEVVVEPVQLVKKVQGGRVLLDAKPAKKATKGGRRGVGIVEGKNEKVAVVLNKEYGKSPKEIANIFKSYAHDITTLKNRSAVKGTLHWWKQQGKEDSITLEDRREIDAALSRLGII